MRDGIAGASAGDGGESGPLVAVGDSRFDPISKEVGKLGLPVVIHVADPDAFFLPTDRFSERWEELARHLGWSFPRGDISADTQPTVPRMAASSDHSVRPGQSDPRQTVAMLPITGGPVEVRQGPSLATCSCGTPQPRVLVGPRSRILRISARVSECPGKVARLVNSRGSLEWS